MYKNISQKHRSDQSVASLSHKKNNILLVDCINSSIANRQFLTELKVAHVIPIFKKVFRSRYGMQNALLNSINQQQSCLNKSGVAGTFLMDLTKRFDCLPHEFILVKLYAHGGETKICRLSQEYNKDLFWVIFI